MGNPSLPSVAITSLAPNRLFGWGCGFFWAAPAWPTESIEVITSITTATSIASPKNALAFAFNTLLSGLTSMFCCSSSLSVGLRTHPEPLLPANDLLPSLPRFSPPSLCRLVACYPVLRIRAPKHSPWRAPRDDLNDSSYQGTVLDFSIFQPYEVTLVGEPGEADTQTLINTVYADYLPNKVVASCAPDDEEDAGLIPLLADRPRAMAGRSPTSVKATPARTRRPTRRGWRGSSAFRRDRHIGGRPSILPGVCTPEEGNVGKGSARNRPQVSGSGIPQERPAVNRLLTVELSTGPLAAFGWEGVAH